MVGVWCGWCWEWGIFHVIMGSYVYIKRICTSRCSVIVFIYAPIQVSILHSWFLYTATRRRTCHKVYILWVFAQNLGAYTGKESSLFFSRSSLPTFKQCRNLWWLVSGSIPKQQSHWLGWCRVNWPLPKGSNWLFSLMGRETQVIELEQVVIEGLVAGVQRAW